MKQVEDIKGEPERWVRRFNKDTKSYPENWEYYLGI